MNLPDLPSDLLGVAVQTSIIYAFLLVLLRIAGRREIGQLTTFEFVSVLVISDAVQNSMVGENATIWGGMVAASILVFGGRLLEVFVDRSRRTRRFVEGSPRLLACEGHLIRDAMREEGITIDELKAAMRLNGVALVRDVRLAVLERNGAISVVAK